jgi:hypothetical protein
MSHMRPSKRGGDVPAEAEHSVRRGASAQARAAVSRRPALLSAAAAALLALLGVVLWLVLRDGDESSSSQRAPASAASLRRLNEFASSVGHPVYWVGTQPRFTYELSHTKDGRVYIRYLPPGVKVGSGNPNYLTVGTYPLRNAFKTIRATAREQGFRALDIPGGGVAFQYKSRPTSVYLAYPGSNYQIEVFDPSPARALRVVTSGQIKPVGAAPSTLARSQAASRQQLKGLAVTLGHPIYWAGAQGEFTYELTRTRSGSVYIRYLPTGVSVGERRPDFLTIGTYPQKHALEILKRTAARNQVPTIGVADDGLALVDKKHPTSVYVAFPNVALQIEVYDPHPGRAEHLVSSGQITPVR